MSTNKENWINVEDDLPPVEDTPVYYLFMDKKYAGFYGGCGEYGEVFYGDNGFLRGDVTHWMPREDE